MVRKNTRRTPPSRIAREAAARAKRHTKRGRAKRNAHGQMRLFHGAYVEPRSPTECERLRARLIAGLSYNLEVIDRYKHLACYPTCASELRVYGDRVRKYNALMNKLAFFESEHNVPGGYPSTAIDVDVSDDEEEQGTTVEDLTDDQGVPAADFSAGHASDTVPEDSDSEDEYVYCLAKPHHQCTCPFHTGRAGSGPFSSRHLRAIQQSLLSAAPVNAD